MTEASPETSIKSVEEDARDRADFIKRLFAVAVSVGFASQLIQLQQAGGWLSSSHFWFLIVGLFLIINSWEHDFRSLRDKPLNSEYRFYVDIIIVFSYLVLLASRSTTQFLATICFIFLLYVIWDRLSYAEHTNHYEPKDQNSSEVGLSYVGRLIHATKDEHSLVRPKLSTILALLYFAEIYFANLGAKHWSPYFYLVLVTLGLLAYRYDQRKPQSFKLAAVPAVLGFVLILGIYL